MGGARKVRHHGPAMPEALRILVVEDEPLTRSTIVEFLRIGGHDVREAADARGCHAALALALPDLVLLDLGLPDSEGLALAKALQDIPDLALIIVTSRAEMDLRISALDAGADDYLVKPIHLEELAARIRTVMRRKNSPGRQWSLGSWLLDTERRRLTDHAGQTVILTRGEFDLLACLAEAGGKIVTRDRLGEVVNRGAHPPEPRTADALVSRLRRKLDPTASTAPVIVTVPGFGYRLEVARLTA